MDLTPVDVARVFAKAKVRYVLVGAHALNLYTGKPRATQDVDVVIEGPVKAAKAVRQAWPHFIQEVHPVVIRYKDGERQVLNLIKGRSGPLFRKVLRLTNTVEMGGEQVVVPTPEAALALKFLSMTNLTRSTDDRMQDAVDFSRAAKVQRDVDGTLLRELGELAWTGGGDALLKFLADARAGRRLEV